ncbi:unnamed protein product [Rotaria socialis]|uniref:Potassium channel tetramerisation-type BTB domain-containing protein n=1 Tax=Rotaria socialis TaxID=392032 RepID=A0A817URE2_9BILA|nr:unnamed protein product [Rotaria socialis]CAF3330084.1 unnamed protein product [Rotaria socialis]CAF3415790.1 unnamed protein product [Rotaria socialis]CAF3582771.1 unnamed protein product [Rotaria socialis]CAF3644610.1 unnamed protein product [Rotaria socialis]
MQNKCEIMSSSPAQKIQETTNNKDVVGSSHSLVSSPSKFETKLMSPFCISTEDDPIILLNIGGVNLSTKQSTLTCIPNTVLALACTDSWSEKMTRDNDGRLFFDLDPNLFQHLLNQLREWSPKRKVFELPRNEFDRQRFCSLCYQLNFHRDLVDGISRHEKFNKTFGHILLHEKSSLAIHASSYRHAECRGMNVYSTGINRIILTLKHDSIEKYSTFIGIIWSTSPMQEKSFESSTAYGWAGEKQVFLKGLPSCVEGYGGYDSDICTNDTIELTLNCQLGVISMFNYRTKKIYQIIIDTREGCPFPWQLHINLFAPGDRVKIINPT